MPYIINMRITTLLQYITCLIFSKYIKSPNILILGVYIDSLYSALKFLETYIVDTLHTSEKLTASIVITKVNSLYEIPTINRYIYYIICCILHIIFRLILWNNYNNILYPIIQLLLVPSIINFLSKCKYSKELFKFIENEKQSHIRTIICKLTKNCINNLFKLYNIRSDISDNEVLSLFINYNKMISYIIEFAKNMSVVLITHFFRNKPIHKKIFKSIYKLKTGIKLNYYNSHDQSLMILNIKKILETKNWDKLIEPVVLQSIIDMYQSNNDSDTIKKILNTVKLKIIHIFSLWTLAAVLYKTYLVHFFHIIICCYEKRKKMLSPSFIVSMYISFILGKYLQNYFLISAITVLFDDVIFSKPTKLLSVFLLQKIYGILHKYNYFHNNYKIYYINIVYLFAPFLSSLCNKILYHFYPSYFLGLSMQLIVPFILQNFTGNLGYLFIYFISYILGSLSEYNFFHYLIISYIFYIGINILMHINNKYILAENTKIDIWGTKVDANFFSEK